MFDHTTTLGTLLIIVFAVPGALETVEISVALIAITLRSAMNHVHGICGACKEISQIGQEAWSAAKGLRDNGDRPAADPSRPVAEPPAQAGKTEIVGILTGPRTMRGIANGLRGKISERAAHPRE